MATGLQDMLADIRRSLGVTGREQPRVAAVEERLERAPKGLIPERGRVEGAERLALFQTMAEGVQASVDVVDTADAVPAAIAAFLRTHNLPAAARIGSDPRLAAMPWRETALTLAHGPSDGRDLNGISHAFAAVAETGTLVMVSGAENPTTVSFLPDNHIVVVNARDLGGDIETAMERVRRAYGKGEMPRTVNFITGPSRSADIEQKLQLGAHGPRNLHILIVEK